MTKRFGLCGLATAIVDLIVEVPENDFIKLGLVRGSTAITTREEQELFLQALKDFEPSPIAGGSVANSVVAHQQLGGGAAVISCVGEDVFGERYKKDLLSLGVKGDVPSLTGEVTGTSLVMVTPDSERTMRTFLGAGTKIGVQHLNTELLQDSSWLLLEGYMLANGDDSVDAMRTATKICKDSGGKIAFSLSDAFVPKFFSHQVNEIISHTDLLFGNEVEVATITEEEEPLKAEAKLAKMVENYCITRGKNGVVLKLNGSRSEVPAFDCTPIDTTGAGDIFAGTLIYGLNQGLQSDLAAEGACFLAMRVITQLGARLPKHVPAEWHQRGYLKPNLNGRQN